VAPGTKFAPLTCKVNATPLATVEVGESEEIVGTGFSAVGGPCEMANAPPVLCAISVQGAEESGVRAPEEGLMENPMICANPVNPLV
jgi:hypothetical protein